MKFVVTSKNQMKIDAVKSVIQKILGSNDEFVVEGISSSSDVSEQPLSLEETKRGSVNRIYNANVDDADFYVSIESGVEREFDSFYGFTFATVCDKTKNKFGFGMSTKFPIPDDVSFGLEQGKSLSSISHSENGLISILTDSFIKRSDLVEEATCTALIPFHFFPISFPTNSPPELTRFIDSITQVEKNNLASQLRQLDFRDQKIVDSSTTASSLSVVEPPADYSEVSDDIFDNGVEAIKAGEVAVVIMSGGQGSRLSAPVPKGMMQLDIPSNSSLLELQLQRVRNLERKYCSGNTCIPVYILTSDATHSPLAAYLIKNQNFGVKHLMLVKQKTLPARSADGHFVLSERSKVLAAPNGNGAVFACLKDSGALSEMKSLGVKYVDIHPIDNALAKPADPSFVGAMIYEDGDAALKVVRKVGGGERMGTVCTRNGKTAVVEYSELPQGQAEQYMYGNTAMHLFATEIIEKAAEAELPYHVAIKKEKVVNEKGDIVVGEVRKFERFIFDALELCERVVLYEVKRDDEFAPVKNAQGAPVDSPETAKELLLKLHKKWAIDNGVVLKENGVIEFSPLTTYAGEGLEYFGLDGKVVDKPMVI
ncbi:UDPGP type 1 family protein [Histomonas meleagridis]|uniref:UDPGP type 1 family protein n=1 Tax=Histomonas meleagridis TaxID=135588 RepID=UPI00355A292D|nr:UDPGP type 1 family protein [Histomonas meleagridis]KAH0801024.1 UDPGP type 1 family protein [Histomonas meleagridis]